MNAVMERLADWRDGLIELLPDTGPFKWVLGLLLVYLLLAIGLGMTGYGALYFFFHDVLVHRRLKLPFVPERGYLNRVVRAHLVHHRTTTKEGAVSFGFLFAGDPEKLKARMRANAARARATITERPSRSEGRPYTAAAAHDAK